MDLNQVKLTRTEWTSIEIPVNDDEKKVLNLITEGYNQPNIRINDTVTLYTNLKIPPSPEMDYYLYKNQFEPLLNEMLSLPTSSDASKSKLKDARPNKSASMTDKTMLPFRNVIQQFMESVSHIKCKTPTKSDLFRLNNTIQMVKNNRHLVFEYFLLDLCKNMLFKKKEDTLFEVYVFIQMKKNTIVNINKYVLQFMDSIIDHYNPASEESIRAVFSKSKTVIEKNRHLIHYEDMALYPHQKKLFEIFRKNNMPKLVLYMAPTGTGKTLSPIGLSQQYRVIFVCVARHVGLALAKSAISVGKKVAFAFGCETASDIRLHYFAASDYKINKRSGGIGKVDNSVGDKVEIMICDVMSYITAMHYMLAFNAEPNIITYWDEPTITMDYETHELHEIIHRNWTENKISKVVLSCATLPKQDEIAETLHLYKHKFSIPADPAVYDEDEEFCGKIVYGYMAPEDEDIERVEAEVYAIDSYDCKKSISLVNKEGYSILPHLLFDSYRELLRSVDHCEENKTLLRYFDISEIIRFVEYVKEKRWIPTEYYPEKYFKHCGDVDMKSIKLYYMEVLRNVDNEHWTEIHVHLKGTNTTRYYIPNIVDLKKYNSMDTNRVMPILSHHNSELTRTMSVNPTNNTQVPPTPTPIPATAGILLTTQDAYTLTDGPSIYLAEDVDKLGKFYIHHSKIPEHIFSQIIKVIETNELIRLRMDALEKKIETKMESGQSDDKTKGKGKEKEKMDKECVMWSDQINDLKEQIKTANIPQMYVPNTKLHQEIWVPKNIGSVPNAFIPCVDDYDVKQIMELDVSIHNKLLLILGIGVFSVNLPQAYMEIMKRLASNQKLFLIIASSDYIYGTNYQFCHGIIGKDLNNMTQQKTIQAIGRIGRNNIQNDYSVRFRDDEIMFNLFTKQDNNMEARVMNRLFV